MTDGPIDHAVLTELQETTGAEFANELIAAFLDEAPGLLAELKTAIDAQDSDAFRRAAHSIKSNAHIFGAHILAEHARRLELAGLNDDPASDRAAAAALSSEFRTAAKALEGAMDG